MTRDWGTKPYEAGDGKRVASYDEGVAEQQRALDAGASSEEPPKSNDGLEYVEERRRDRDRREATYSPGLRDAIGVPRDDRSLYDKVGEAVERRDFYKTLRLVTCQTDKPAAT
jgi:hypothetical protein